MRAKKLSQFGPKWVPKMFSVYDWTNPRKKRRRRMSEDIEKIRAKKMAEIQNKMKSVEKDYEEVQAMQNQFTWQDFGFDEPDWGFRLSEEMEGAFEVCQQGQIVAMTADPKWALLVTDLLNRARLEELIMTKEKEPAEDAQGE